jgi:hypothetical protein
VLNLEPKVRPWKSFGLFFQAYNRVKRGLLYIYHMYGNVQYLIDKETDCALTPHRCKEEKETRARICKRLRNPGIDSEESMPPAYVD